MKRFLEGTLQWKTAACFMFTGSAIVTMLVFSCFGQQYISIMTLLSLLIISALGTFIQFLAFTDTIIKNLRYSLRLLLFAVPFLLLLTCCAYFFAWFPTEEFGSWAIFVGIFVGIFCIMTLAFELYYRYMGKKYDGLLGQYRKQQEKQK